MLALRHESRDPRWGVTGGGRWGGTVLTFLPSCPWGWVGICWLCLREVCIGEGEGDVS